MKKILYKTIACLLIPSLVFAQIPQNQANKTTIKQTDPSRIWNALNTDVGQQIVSYIETAVGSINLEQAKAFSINNGEVAFVPIKSFSKALAALCYRQLDDGTEYLFLITYNATQKGVSFTFPSGRMYVMNSVGIKESVNPDFSFQLNDDLGNRVRAEYDNLLIQIICYPFTITFVTLSYIFLFTLLFLTGTPLSSGNVIYLAAFAFVLALGFQFLIPILFVVYAFINHDLNLGLISIFTMVYFYGCYAAGS